MSARASWHEARIVLHHVEAEGARAALEEAMLAHGAARVTVRASGREPKVIALFDPRVPPTSIGSRVSAAVVASRLSLRILEVISIEDPPTTAHASLESDELGASPRPEIE